MVRRIFIPEVVLFNISAPIVPITNIGFGKKVKVMIFVASFVVIVFLSSNSFTIFALLGRPDISEIIKHEDDGADILKIFCNGFVSILFKRYE